MNIEKSIHDEMRELAQSISDRHGIRINQIKFDWTDLSTFDNQLHIISEVEMITTTKEPK